MNKQVLTISLGNDNKEERYTVTFDATGTGNFSRPIADAVYAFSMALLGTRGTRLVADYLQSSVQYLCDDSEKCRCRGSAVDELMPPDSRPIGVAKSENVRNSPIGLAIEKKVNTQVL